MNKNTTIGLLAGGFKPPHKGHFSLLKSLENKVDKAIVFIGPVIRSGELITPQQAKQIWQIYSNLVRIPVEVIISEVTPIKDILSFVKDNQDDYRNIIISTTKEREDRYTSYIKKEDIKNVEVFINDEVKDGEEEKLSGSTLRGNVDYLKSLKWTPTELSEKDKQKIYSILKKTIQEQEIESRMLETVDKQFDLFFKEEKTEEGSSGTPIAARSAIPSKDRAKLVNLYNHLQNVIYSPNYDIDFQQDRIVISLKDKGRISYDYTPFMGSLIEYMLDEGMKILPLPEIKVINELEEAVDIFGKTAYYDPYKQEIVLYAMGRHPKDVMRSFAHEMVHHMQNLEGRINNIKTTNTNEDGSLLELEQEAYLTGNITFRNWEDKIKNS